MTEQIVRLNWQQQVALDEAAEAEVRRYGGDPKQALKYMMMLNVQLQKRLDAIEPRLKFG